jgi:hypothetical protein
MKGREGSPLKIDHSQSRPVHPAQREYLEEGNTQGKHWPIRTDQEKPA